MGAGSKSRYILDCDAGTDDAQALMMALTHGVPMMAVTCVFGNTTVDNVTRNVLRVLNVCDRLDIPVYKGCEVSLLGEGSSLCGYHGNDGLGDVIHSREPSEHLVKDQHAANALVSLVNKYPDEITLIATGPLTNIALALRLDPKFGTKLKQCIIMGGNTKGRGNVSMSAEFNFHTDPEAAYSVFRDLGNPITLIPLELCWKRSFSWEWYDDLVNRSTVKAQFLKACDHKMVTRNKAMGNPCHFMHDQLAVAAAIRSDVITETRHVYATVELVGTQTRGQVVLDWSLDWSGASNNKPNVHVVTKIDRELYERLIMEAVENPNATLDN